MKHLDRRIYAGTALVGALATVAVLYTANPVDLGIIGSANARAHSDALVTWKGVRNIVMHESMATSPRRAADK